MSTTLQTEQRLWQELAARGAVQGECPEHSHAPWAVRCLMGAAGWLGALFFQMFLVGTVFVAARENGIAMAVTGLAMIALAALLYWRGGGIAASQFALAVSLCGQGMAVYGLVEALGFARVTGTAGFWAGIALFEGVLVLLVPNRLHRLLCGLGVWIGLAGALHLALPHGSSDDWRALTWTLGWLAPLGCALVTAFTLAEARVCAAGRHALLEPLADATLLAALAMALVVTGMSHPMTWLFGPEAGRLSVAHWMGGALLTLVLAGFSLAECRRLATGSAMQAAVLAGTLAFGALMAAAPAVVAGALALALALRRASMAWMGLGVTAIAVGFVWYYSALHWTLPAKSVTLAAAGVLLLAGRHWLLRGRTGKEFA
ncbi:MULTISPECIES: DUF4401 domain-containing protein [Cupriavidus]|uniref:DUF4401 domain-containing protein n=2 Tax=Cupriavidus TaxID=106589 RepID=A0A4P7LE60_9BURK|nr:MULTISPECIES: DUF4401 domain-containing protein [Cupriavidus]MBF6990891.1 DUF4401 domain-containing protein [Cupriavidus sp. IK-TO18]QBY54406.1 DUF4401 domain-containing protein [Cupriavidus oxalaticus]